MLGWGLLSENGDQPSVLQKATVPFLPYGNLQQLIIMITVKMMITVMTKMVITVMVKMVITVMVGNDLKLLQKLAKRR